jgi:YD repeat-containing protein
MTNVSETPSGSTTVTSLAQYAYDPLSRRTTLTYANGASTAYSYDAFSGLSQIAHTFANTGKLPTE